MRRMEVVYEHFTHKIYKEALIPDFRTLLQTSMQKYPRRAAFQLRAAQDTYRYITYGELWSAYRTLGQALLDRGLGGASIAVIGKNSYEWSIAYLCAASVGVVVPIDRELHPDDQCHFIQAAHCACVIAEDTVLDALAPQLPDGCYAMPFSQGETSVTACIACPPPAPHSVIDTWPMQPDACHVIIFTSGTTGKSKGVCLSQTNILANVQSTTQMVKITRHARTLSLLPLHHTYECSLNFLLILSRGACITYADSLLRVAKNIQEYRPTVLVVVPAILRMMNRKIRNELARKCPKPYRALFQEKSIAEAFEALPFFLRPVLRYKVRASLGGRLERFIVGAADVPAVLVRDFMALGIQTLQGYGLTECAPLLAGNSDFFLNPDSTGRPIPGVTLKIDQPDANGVGEILARGKNIMLGYYEDEASTREVMRGGWFHTGDLGRIDSKGYLYIMGRLKNVIVTANGKNVYPEELETRLGENRAIGEALVLGARDEQGEICVKAKIFPNRDYLKELLGHLPSMEEIQNIVRTIVEQINERLPVYQRIRVYEVLTAELEHTTTRKIKRCGRNLA